MSKRTSIHRTEQFAASNLFQNHLDVIHGLFEAYCTENKDYHWGVVSGTKRFEAGDGGAYRYINKQEPDTLKYYVASYKNKAELILYVSDGVSISIKSGTHELYGLFTMLLDACNSMSSPHLLVFFRKYWVFNLLAAGMIIPILVILLAGGGWWFLAWILFGGVIEFLIIAALLTTSDWDDYILSTKIQYGEYSNKTLGITASIFGSVRGVVSILASFATIVTFIIFLTTRQ